ncbi:hypothetical protein GOODEAATRI_018305, partial [Goodea atripinnis]
KPTMTPPPASTSPPDSLSHFYMILPLACVGVSVLLLLLVLLVRRRLCRKAAGNGLCICRPDVSESMLNVFL